MKRTRLLALLLSLLLALNALVLPGGAGAAVYIEPDLQAALAAATSEGQIEAIVNYDPLLTTGAALTGAIQELGAGTITFDNLDSVAVIGTASQINLIAALAGVTRLYANTPQEYFLHESVSFIGADRAWDELGVTGKGIGVAVLDSGVDAGHPDLAYGTKTVQNVKIIADPTAVYNFKGKANRTLYLENQTNTDTSSGHGTHVAGIVAGSGAASGGYYTGVAKDAHLLGIGAGDTLFITWALAGFDYLLDNAGRYNIKAVNNSWGSTRKAERYDPEHPINKASKKAHDRGITVVFSAGNSGPDPDTMNHYAMAPWVVGVAAGCKPQHAGTRRCPDGYLAAFSSRGVAGHPTAHPTLTAPGVLIASDRASTGSTINALTASSDLTGCVQTKYVAHYTCASGTSMASPHVAGAVALMQQAAGGTLTPDRVKDILVRTATPMVKTDGTPYGLWEAGAGYLDAYAAVQVSTTR